MKTKIKICGLNSIENIEFASKLGALWYGLVFFKKSPRNVTINKAKTLIKKSPKEIIPVAIVVDPEIDFIEKLINIGIQTIQLHGKESPSFCKKLIDNYKLKVIKAISVKNSLDVLNSKKYENIVDWILFDNKSNDLPGGSGITFDWSYLKEKKLDCNWILSGGLNNKNVIEALKETNALALDVSSGIEVEAGIKSNTLIENFINSVKIYEEKKLA